LSTVLLIVLWGLGQSFTAKLLSALTLLASIIARKTLKNTISGIQIAYSEPFSGDDWIKVGSSEGIVKKTTLNNTIIQSLDGEKVIIPNSFINNNIVVNKSNAGKLKQNIKISVPIENKPKYIKDVVEEVLRETDSILQIPDPQINISEIGESEMIVNVQYWIEKPHRRQIHRTKDNIMKDIREVFLEESILQAEIKQ